MGLETKLFMPAARQAWRSSIMAAAVMATITGCRSAGSVRRMVLIAPTDAGSLDNLMDAAAYRVHLAASEH